MSFIRRMLEGTAILRYPDEGGAPDADPATAGSQAGGTPAEPGAGSPPADAGTAAGSDAEGGEGAPPVAAESEAPPATSPLDKTQQRMNQLVAERWTERRRAEAAEQQARLLQERLQQVSQTVQPTVDAEGNPITPPVRQPVAQPPQDLQRMAAEIAAQNEFNRQVGEEVLRGRGAHQDFDQVAANLQRFGELPRTFVEAALATGKGADVMYHLGGDIAEADRILSLPPIQQAVALSNLANSIKPKAPPKTVTSAPAPVTPKVGGGRGSNTPSLEDPNIPIADFIKMREKELAAKRASR